MSTDRGRRAEQPQGIPARGWRDVALRVGRKIRTERVPLAAAGVAFYAMLAVFPAVIGLVSVYGLVADPLRLEEHLAAVTAALPREAGRLVAEQLVLIVTERDDTLTWGFLFGLVVALVTASAGMHGLMQALSIANNEDEDRSFLHRRVLALLLTIGAVLFFAVTLGVVVAVPLVLENVGLGSFGEMALRLVRWPVLAVLFGMALAVIYRYAPNRREARWRWVSWGAVIAVTLWLLGSLTFSLYVERFGHYNETYGTLGGGVILLLWLFLSSFVVLLGAMINAELEHQTLRDTTRGAARPLGDRGAYVADHIGQAQE